MSHTPHELNAEFPDFAEQMTALRASNAHFARLADRYHSINRSVHRAETNVEPTDDMHMIEMRRKRMEIKDEIYQMLKSA